MHTKTLRKPLIVALLALFTLNACTGLELGAADQEVTTPPATVTATATSDTTIDVSWSAVPQARKYYVLESVGAGPYNYIATVLAPGTTFTATNLTPATTYSFEIITADLDGTESGPSAPATATTTTSASQAPSNVSATATSTSTITVTWTGVANAVKYYVLQSNGGPYVAVATVFAPTTTYFATGLTPATTYSYEIIAALADGRETVPSAPASATTNAGTVGPPAPTGVTATATSSSSINVTWNAVSGAAKYYVFQAQGAGPSTFAATVLAPSTSYLATGLAASTTYSYTVETVLVDNTVSAPSAPPATATTFAVGSGSLEGYYKFDERTGNTAIDSSGNSRNGSLGGGALYDLSNRAPVDDNRSSLSIAAGSSAKVTVPNAAGFNLNADFSVSLWVNIPASGTVQFVGMRAAGCGAIGWELGQDATNGLYFASGSGVRSSNTSLPIGSWNHVAVTSASGILRFYVNGTQVAGGGYTTSNAQAGNLEVGHDGGCTGGAVLLDEVRISSRALSDTEVQTIGTTPPAPTNLVVSSKSSASMTLTWTAVAGATSYIISKGTGPGNEAFYTHSPNTPTFVADHLSPGTQYSWTVRAVVNGLLSPPSNEVVDTTLGAPAAPTGVTATVIAPDRISVSWTASPAAVKYYVFESVNGGTFNYRGSVVAPATNFVAVNLLAGTTYAYEIQAEDNNQTLSALSAPASATTP